jgi:chemotaxis protein CheD
MTVNSVKIMQCLPAASGELKIDCIGIGVGIILHSSSKKVGVGVHVLAPRSASPTPDNPAKYANSAIPHAIELIEKEGATPPYSVAIAGGAAMAGSPTGASIGEKVVDAVKEAISNAKLNISIDETGGNNIRSMLLNVETGDILIK